MVIPNSPGLSRDLIFYRGMALARMGKWRQARRTLESGRLKFPKDERFPVELAGIAFRRKNYVAAEAELRVALRLDPQDRYATGFLATVYFLEHNLDAALQQWNRIGEPRIHEVKTGPSLRIAPALLDRAFAFSPASVLKLNDLRTSRARLEQLGIFPRFRFDLQPASSGKTTAPFDLNFVATERNGLGSSPLEGFASLLSGLPYETIYPAFYNLDRRAINLTSLVRWDPEKRRLFVAFSAPLHGNPAWRYQVYADLRDENWDLAQTLHQTGSPLSDLKLRRWEAGADIRSVVSGRWNWTTGVAAARRTFSNFDSTALGDEPAFTNSFSLEYRLGTDYLLLDSPGERFTLDFGISTQLGKIFARPYRTYSRAEGSLTATWFPQAEGDDYEITEQTRLGGISGAVPLDELFMLGLERDNNLPMRAHIGTENGMKGSAPLGRDYFLSNWTIRKIIYQNGWLGLKLAPFLDSGRITGESGLFGSRRWLWDTGAEARIHLLTGLKVVLTYGKDLRTGRNTFYATALH
jgi:hypothetical protein